MACKLTFSIRAKLEISETLDYYDTISSVLSKEFEDDLTNTYHKLKLQPSNYFNINRRFRRITLSKFPYQFAYTIVEEENEVLLLPYFISTLTL